MALHGDAEAPAELGLWSGTYRQVTDRKVALDEAEAVDFK